VAGYSLPFSMSRTGEAEIFERETSAPIAKQLEGSWNGTLAAGGRSLRLMLRLANRPDGTAAGSLVSLDEGGLEIPVAITQDAMAVTISAGITGSTFSVALTADGTELAGTFTQRGFSAPITFRATRPDALGKQSLEGVAHVHHRANIDRCVPVSSRSAPRRPRPRRATPSVPPISSFARDCLDRRRFASIGDGGRCA